MGENPFPPSCIHPGAVWVHCTGKLLASVVARKVPVVNYRGREDGILVITAPRWFVVIPTIHMHVLKCHEMHSYRVPPRSVLYRLGAHQLKIR